MTRSAPRTPRVDEVRALLRRDPWWSVYALGDLDPRRQAHCEWYVRGSSVALLYREFDEPILFAAGAPEVLDALPDEEACLLQVPETFLPAIEQRLVVDWIRPMHRMSLRPGEFVPAGDARAVQRLDESHEDELRALFADGHASREDPDFFMRSQLADGTFFGVRVDGRLVAAGGTHLYSAAESVGAIGNVYTHRSHRGRGYATAVTAAIVRQLTARGIRTTALNVKAENATAIRLYERLGFTFHTRYWEGRATRR